MNPLSRRSFLIGLSAAPLAAGDPSWARAQRGLMFAGTYTDRGSTSKGIYAYRWDAEAGRMASLGLAAESTNPSFLALSPDRGHLYAVNEVDEYQGAKTGSVSAFAVDRDSGKLAARNVVSSGGSGPCNISVDHTGKAVFVADYSGGSAASYRVLPDGSLSTAVSNFHYRGHSVNAQRQSTPHAHCVTVSPDNRYLLINDLGLDRITVYGLDAESARLTQNVPAFYRALPGSGPRNLSFHPSGRWAYSINEMGSSIDVLAWNPAHGALERVQNISTLAPDFKGESAAATVAVDAAGRFVYGSNRGADTIAVFSVDAASGRLTPVQQIECGGKTPRHFALDPSNRWLLAANQDSSNIAVFARDPQSGRLTATAAHYPLSFPVCLVFC